MNLAVMTPCVLALLANACSDPTHDAPDAADDSDGGQVDDASLTGDGRLDDGAPTATWVTGVLGESGFVLMHAVVIFDEPLSTLCVSTVPIQAPSCGLDDRRDKIVFFGKFGFDMGEPRWAIPQVELRQVPAGALELAKDGALTLQTFDPGAGAASGELTVDFPSGTTMGSFVVP